MKNMKKFITLCGFLILGSIACGDADVVKAEAINEQTTDTSGYTITIPSEISFSTDTTNFDISAGLDKSTQIIITASSQNGFNLTNRDDTIPYSISDNLITLSNSRPDISNTVSQSLNIFMDKSKNPMYGGDYKDTLTFNIQEKQLYTLNVNGLLDGNTVSWLNGYGTFGIKINGRTISNLTDFYQSQAEGTTYEIFNIKATDGKHYIGDTIIKGTFDSPYQEINLKFDTNKLTVNYYPNGAQKYSPASDYDPNQEFSINPNDIFKSKEYKYDEDFPQYGLDDADRFKRTGYTCNNMYLVGSSTSTVKVNAGSNVYAKSQDLAEAAKVLSEFKKNDVTINLYPGWTPIQSQLNLNANGGTFSDNSTFKTATDKLVYDSSSNTNLNSYTPTRKGYDFDGWYTDETGGTKVYNADGSAVNGTQYWQNNVYQNIEGTNILRGDAGQNMAEYLYCGNASTQDSVIDNGWVSDTALTYGKCKKITINHPIGDGNNCTGSYSAALDDYCKRTFQSTDVLKNKSVTLCFKIKSDSPMAFNYWGIENSTTHTPFILKTSSEWQTITLKAILTDTTMSVYHALTFYTSLSSVGTYYIGDVSLVLDSDVELFAHWTKKNYSAGTVLNIEGSEYVVLEQKENNQALVMTADSIGHKKFQSNSRTDGQNQSTYEGSEIDNYLENEWYNSLSYTMKSVIQATNIKQASYSNDSPDAKQETGPNGQVYNTISRRAFLPSVSEIGKVVNLKNPDKVEAFLDGTHIWTRDSCQEEAYYAEYLNAYGGLSSYDVDFSISVRPVFVIDLSKVNYTVTGTVNYK